MRGGALFDGRHMSSSASRQEVGKAPKSLKSHLSVLWIAQHKKHRLNDDDSLENPGKRAKRAKRTIPGIPTWSPTVVLTGPEHA